MTLIVSLIIPDGIVIAGDSLSTFTTNSKMETLLNTKCPKCENEYQISHTIDMIPTASSNLSSAKKIFPLFEKFGIGTYGLGSIQGKTVYFTMRMLEYDLKQKKQIPGSVEEIAEVIKNYIHNLVMEEINSGNININRTPAGIPIVGFHVVGYDGTVPKTMQVHIHTNSSTFTNTQPGIELSGQGDIAHNILEMYSKNPASQPAFNLFALQDAVDYAEYLIQSTITHQRFSPRIPNVGGQIDIAQVTPFDGFQWIKRK